MKASREIATENDLDALHQSALKLFEEQNYEKVLEIFDQAVEINSRDATVWRSAEILKLKANSLKHLGRWAEAGMSYMMLDQADDALNCFEAAVRFEPSNARNYVGKGDALFGLERYADAIAEYEHAENVDSQGSRTSQWTDRANRLVELSESKMQEQSRFAEITELALRCYDNAIRASFSSEGNNGSLANNISSRTDSDLFWALRGKGKLLFEQNDLQRALECFEQAANIDPNSAWIWVDRGNVEALLLRYDEAVKSYEKALSLDSKYAVALAAKGQTLQSKGEYEKAVAAFDDLIELEPKNQLAWLSKGLALSSLGHEQQAIACYDRTLEIAGQAEQLGDSLDTLWAWNNKGWSFDQLGEFEKAVECFDKAIQLDQTELVPWENKANALGNLGRYQEAIACMEGACSVVRDKDAASLALANARADFCDSTADCERALDVIAEGVKRNPQDDFARANLAETLIKLGMYRQGQDEIITLLGRPFSMPHHPYHEQLQLILRYLLLVSYALEGDAPNRSKHFVRLLDHFRSLSTHHKLLGRFWRTRALARSIAGSNVEIETKFNLLAVLDLIREVSLPADPTILDLMPFRH